MKTVPNFLNECMIRKIELKLESGETFTRFRLDMQKLFDDQDRNTWKDFGRASLCDVDTVMVVMNEENTIHSIETPHGYVELNEFTSVTKYIVYGDDTEVPDRVNARLRCFDGINVAYNRFVSKLMVKQLIIMLFDDHTNHGAMIDGVWQHGNTLEKLSFELNGMSYMSRFKFDNFRLIEYIIISEAEKRIYTTEWTHHTDPTGKVYLYEMSQRTICPDLTPHTSTKPKFREIYSPDGKVVMYEKNEGKGDWFKTFP